MLSRLYNLTGLLAKFKPQGQIQLLEKLHTIAECSNQGVRRLNEIARNRSGQNKCHYCLMFAALRAFEPGNA